MTELRLEIGTSLLSMRVVAVYNSQNQRLPALNGDAPVQAELALQI